MAITFRGKQRLGGQVLKLFVEGEPVSSSEDLSIADVFETYKRIADELSKSSADVAALRSGPMKARLG